MADFTNPFPDAGVKFWTIMAAATGSLLSLRTLVDAGPLVRMSAVGSSFALAFYGGPYISRMANAGEDGERFITLIVAFLGVNLLAGFAMFGAKWRDDPQGAIVWLFSLWGSRPK